MATRFRALLWLVAIVGLAACAGRSRDEGPAPAQVHAGAAEQFGLVITTARPGTIVLELSRPAYVVVARFGAVAVGELVYPLAGVGWNEFGYRARGAPPSRLAAGTHRLDLPLPWLRLDVLAPPRNSSADGCRYSGRAWACATWEEWRYRQNSVSAEFHGGLPAPDSLVEHHLVVIASTTPFDLAQVRARLDDLHDTRVAALAAAQAAPGYLTVQHAGEWGAATATVRIQGVR